MSNGNWSKNTSGIKFILSDFEVVVLVVLSTDDPDELDDTVSLLESSVVDSTGILELVMFLEEMFEISVSDDEMLPENLDSVDALVRYIDHKKSEAA